MRARPEVASELLAKSAIVPDTDAPAETPLVISAGMGGVASTPNEAESVPRFSARSRTEASTLCWPSARSAPGVNEIAPVDRTGEVSTPSRRSVPEAGSIPDRLSESVTEMPGLRFVVQPPAAGARSERPGETVSNDLNELVNATVCVFPVKSRAPLTSTERLALMGRGAAGTNAA